MACSLDANIAFNNNLFSPATIRPVKVEQEPGHESAKRLHAAARDKGVDGPAAIARALTISDQRVTNWGTRGVSMPGAIKAQEVFGVSATWIVHGTGQKWFEGKEPSKSGGDPPTVRPIHAAPSSPYSVARTLADMLSNLGVDERKFVGIVIEELIRNPKDEDRIAKLGRLLGGSDDQQRERVKAGLG